MTARQMAVVANWKMNGSRKFLYEYFNDFLPSTEACFGRLDIGFCVPFTLLEKLKSLLETHQVGNYIFAGAQNVSQFESGAYTGEISVPMLLEMGLHHVIVGHSERRQYFAESNDSVSQKAKIAIENGLVPIICVGETLEQRKSEKTNQIVGEQLQAVLDVIPGTPRMMIAYEPIWAIGTGLAASSQQAEEVHQFIRNELSKKVGDKIAQAIRIIYGGSVKESNATELFSMPNIDGALVGGASLDPKGFSKIMQSACNRRH